MTRQTDLSIRITDKHGCQACKLDTQGRSSSVSVDEQSVTYHFFLIIDMVHMIAFSLFTLQVAYPLDSNHYPFVSGGRSGTNDYNTDPATCTDHVSCFFISFHGKCPHWCFCLTDMNCFCIIWIVPPVALIPILTANIVSACGLKMIVSVI